MKFYVTQETYTELKKKIEYLEAKEPFIQYSRWKRIFGEWKAYTEVLENCEIIYTDTYVENNDKKIVGILYK